MPIILWGWFIGQIGLLPLAVMSALSLSFLLFQARVPCGAEIRERDRVAGEHLLCRNNAHGILGGCKQYQAHKWQNAKMLVQRSSWGRFVRSLLRRTSGRAAAISALATVASVFVAVGALLVSMVKK